MSGSRPRWIVGAAVTVAAVVGVVGLVARASADRSDRDRDPDPVATGTAPVVRGDLVVVETLEGTLGYAGQQKVLTPVAGTLTAMPSAGSRIDRGAVLFEVDGKPVRLLVGRVPMYRDLAVGSEGRDVLQLERNLRALGYGSDLEVDDEYTAWTAHQVRAWQDDLGVDETGTVAADAVVFLPGPQRVAERELSLGARVQPGQPVLTTSRDRQVVVVSLPVDRRDLVAVGRTARVTLPGGDSVAGVVSEIGTIVTQPETEGDDPTFDVVLRLRGSVTTGLDAAPVEVALESQRRRDVLSVPVAALLAAGEGRYYVDLVTGDGRDRVPVEIGLFSEGQVEVSGPGLAEGRTVVVPS